MSDDPDVITRALGLIGGSIWFFVLIVLLIRLSGKRTASNMNNFDWIVTVSIGSMMASGILLTNVSIWAATLAILSVVGLQWATTWITMRSDRFARLVKPAPRMLVHKGHILRGAMLTERITEDELKSALRSAGMTNAEDANWVIIETNGQLTVIPRKDVGIEESWLLEGVDCDLPDEPGNSDAGDDERGGPDSNDP